MRKSDTQPLKGVIREYIEALGHRRKLQEVNVVSSWEQIMGKMIARNTSRIFIKNRVLYAYINSAVIRNELLMMREKICERINEHAGNKIIDKIILK